MTHSSDPAFRDVGRDAGAWSYDRYIQDHMFPLNGGLTPGALAYTFGLDLSAGAIAAIPQFRDSADVEFQDAVLKDIGTVK